MNNLNTAAGLAGRIAGRMVARTRSTLAAIDWQAVADRIITTARLVAALLVLLAAIAWEHRAQARRWAVIAIAALVVAAELTLEAGRATRRIIDRLADRAAVLTRAWSAGPAAPVAPIAAGITVLAAATLKAGRSCRRWVEAHRQPAATVEAPAPAPAPAPVSAPADALVGQTVTELRRMARQRGLGRKLSRSGRRAELLEALAA